MANFEILSLDPTTPQIRAPGAGDGYSVPRDMTFATGTTLNAPTTVVSVNTSTDALRITQVGSGNALLVEDSANPDASPTVINALGNVGIGTASPNIGSLTGTVLTLNGSVQSNLEMASAGVSRARIASSSTDTTFETRVSAPLVFGTNSTERMRLDSSGNLLVGTTTNKTTIVTAGASGITIGAVSAPTLAIWDSTDAGYISYLSQINENTYLGNNANGFLSFGTNATERARITAAGDVGIGTTTPGQKLEVAGNQRFTGSQVGTKIENRQTAVSVSTATTILDDAGALGKFVVVNGEASGDRFCDLVLCSTGVSPTVVSSFTALGTPAARTYTRSGAALQLAMASGTYNVHVLALGY